MTNRHQLPLLHRSSSKSSSSNGMHRLFRLPLGLHPLQATPRPPAREVLPLGVQGQCPTTALQSLAWSRMLRLCKSGILLMMHSQPSSLMGPRPLCMRLNPSEQQRPLLHPQPQLGQP